jgi:hypothetical protein
MAMAREDGAALRSRWASRVHSGRRNEIAKKREDTLRNVNAFTDLGE